MTSNQETEAYLQTLGELQLQLLKPQLRDLAADLLRNAINERHHSPTKNKDTKSSACSIIERDGFVRIDKVLSSKKIREIKNYFLNKPCYNSHVASHAEEPANDFDYAEKNWKNASYTAKDVVEAPHLIDAITAPELTSIAEEYLGCPPTLTLLNTFWSFPNQHLDSHETQLFHRDNNDYKFLTFFMYLTDVNDTCGPHCYIQHTHRIDLIREILAQQRKNPDTHIAGLASKINPEQLFRGGYADGHPTQDASCRGYDDILNTIFSPFMNTISGNAGTALLADTHGFHKGTPPTQTPRLMFWGGFGLYPNLAYQMDNKGTFPLRNSRKDKRSYLTRHILGPADEVISSKDPKLTKYNIEPSVIINGSKQLTRQTTADLSSRYELGPSVNIYSAIMPDGTYYPNHIFEQDPRPIEFLKQFDAIRDKPWTEYTFIDLGCGEGTSTLALGRTGARVIGIEGRDHVANRGRYMRDRLGYENVEFRTGGVTDPELWEEADALYASGLIHHLADPFQVLELADRFISDAAYFCTHFSPRTQEELSSSEFHSQLFEPHTVQFRGLKIEVIKFTEPHSSAEDGLQNRRHARSGIGNPYSLWPSEDGFIAACGKIGFPSFQKLDYIQDKLRHRYFFVKHSSTRKGNGEFLWPNLNPPDAGEATQRARVQDLQQLKHASQPVVIMGDYPSSSALVKQLKKEGVSIKSCYLTDKASNSKSNGCLMVPAQQIKQDHPEHIVLACQDQGEIVALYNDLAHQFFCKYIYTSFTLNPLNATD
jgi:SAM-dependent methyltransferase